MKGNSQEFSQRLDSRFLYVIFWNSVPLMESFLLRPYFVDMEKAGDAMLTRHIPVDNSTEIETAK